MKEDIVIIQCLHIEAKWARNALDRVWKEKIEFWFKIVLPVIAIIISVIALVKSSKN